MSEFNKVYLEDITVNFDKNRIPLSSKERTYLKKIYPYYGAQGVIDYVDNYLFDGEYIIVAEDGENLKSQKNNICNFVSGKFWVNNHAHILQAKENNNLKYIYYLLNLINFKPYITGSAQPKLTQDNLNKIELTIHDYLTQQKIASVLSALDVKIELNNRINAELEAMAKTLYDYWFVQFDFPNESGKPYKTSDGKMVWNAELKREIPDGWEVETFGKYANLKGGFAFKSDWWTDTGLPVIKIKDINENCTLSIENCSCVNVDKYEKAKKYEAFSGDVVIAMTGATVGKFGIVPKIHKPILVNQRVGLFNLGKYPMLKLPFLICSLNQNYFRENIFLIASGAAQPNISSDQIDAIPLIIPEKNIIDFFNSKTSCFYKKIIENIAENKTLAELRDWLLPMLMNGQVKV